MLESVHWARQILHQLVPKVRRVMIKTGSKIPYTTNAYGDFDDHSSIELPLDNEYSISWWTNSFYPGILWWMYQFTNEAVFCERAVDIETRLSENFDLFLGLHHDVGFMFMPTSVRQWQITGNQQSYVRGLHAANLLAARYNNRGKYIRAWNNNGVEDRSGWTIIDSMMNIELLYWATKQTGDPRFQQIASAHANTIQHYFVRNDGSVKHICEFDPNDGHYVQSYAGQGFARGSAWARGQTWALYGFTNCYYQTHDIAYLNTAIRIADYFIAHTPSDMRIPIDFNQPIDPFYEDTSATAIAASGFLLLATQTNQQQYRDFSLYLLQFLATNRLDLSESCDNLITRASARYHEEKHEYAMIYADYYFIEALLRLGNYSWNTISGT